MHFSPRVVGLITLLLALSGCGLAQGIAAHFGMPVAQSTPLALAEQLRPHDEWFLPERASSHAGVLLAPGCAGTQPFHRDWAELLSRHGFVVLLIDSFKARGIVEPEDLEGACEGEHTWGFERAGDVLVSLEALRTHPNVDAESLHLLGWSHGGWSVMDAVAIAAIGETPPLMSALPAQPLSGVQSVVALYPYCGFGTHTPQFGWPQNAPALLVLAERDQNIEPEPCIETVGRQAAAGKPLFQKLLDVDHWFDNPGGFAIVPHQYDPKATEQIQSSVLRWLAAGQERRTWQ